MVGWEFERLHDIYGNSQVMRIASANSRMIAARMEKRIHGIALFGPEGF